MESLQSPVSLDAGASASRESDPAASAAAFEDQTLVLTFKHAGKSYSIEVMSSDLIMDLKQTIWSLIDVPPERQKILGLGKRLPTDDLPLSAFNLKPNAVFSVIGTPVGKEFKSMPGLNEPSDQSDSTEDLPVLDLKHQQHTPEWHARNQRKIRDICKHTEINFITPPRKGKKLLVLDLDYTLLDCKKWTDPSVSMIDFARPGLDHFLTSLYPHYDFLIWSQTRWSFLETKLVELDMIGAHDRYFMTTVLDKNAMFQVMSNYKGGVLRHHVKPLEVIWKTMGEYYSPESTLHVDDLERNFVLNPQNGIRIRAFKEASKHRSDRELKLLTNYLLSVADVSDVRELDLTSWRAAAKALESQSSTSTSNTG